MSQATASANTAGDPKMVKRLVYASRTTQGQRGSSISGSKMIALLDLIKGIIPDTGPRGQVDRKYSFIPAEDVVIEVIDGTYEQSLHNVEGQLVHSTRTIEFRYGKPSPFIKYTRKWHYRSGAYDSYVNMNDIKWNYDSPISVPRRDIREKLNYYGDLNF